MCIEHGTIFGTVFKIYGLHHLFHTFFMTITSKVDNSRSFILLSLEGQYKSHFVKEAKIVNFLTYLFLIFIALLTPAKLFFLKDLSSKNLS